MAKKKRARAKRAQSRVGATQQSGSDLAEARSIFGRAEQLYSKLRNQRERLWTELQSLEVALSRLQPVVGVAATRVATSKAPSRPAKLAPKAGKAAPSAGAPTLASLLKSAFDNSPNKAFTAAELVQAVRAQRRDVGISGIQKVLRDLRDKGYVRATGKAKRFRYQRAGTAAAALLAKTTPKAVAAKTTPKKAGTKKAAAKKSTPKTKAKSKSVVRERQRSDGAPTVRTIVMEALANGKSMKAKELVGAVLARRRDVSKESVDTIIHKLRRGGVLKTGGQAGDYRYSIAGK